MPIDAKPEFKAKASEVVAKKVGISIRTFERGKKILEKASEEDKQKLREGKASISRVYREVVAPEQSIKHPEKIDDSIKKAMPDIAEALSKMQENKARDPEMNKKILSVILKNLLKESLFCPSCGNTMFECDKCHKTLKESLESKARSDLFGDL